MQDSESSSKEDLLIKISKLEKENSLLKKHKKFGLVWEDKPEKVADDCKTKLPVVEEVVEKAINEAGDEPANLIIEGDNYHALSVLNCTHAGKIDVIYIDPPYNTGEKARDGGFIYNDRFVDKEDSFKHSKWLSFMEKRLQLAKTLLAEDGVIFISIDDHEQHYLKLLCDEVFASNFISDISVVGTANESNDGVLFQNNKESLLVYAKNISKVKINRIDEVKQAPRSLSDAPTGLSTRLSMGYTIYYNKKTGDMIPRFDYDKTKVDTNNVNEIYHDDTELIANGYIPVRAGFRNGAVWRWRWGVETFSQRKDEVSIRKNGTGRYVAEFTQKGYNPPRNVQNFSTGTTELRSIIGQNSFKSPKSLSMLEWVLKVASAKDSIVLDFFAGSGTTGHAVMKLNQEDGGHRQFIICTNNEGNIAEEVMYPRIQKVIGGYNDVKGIPANVRYFKTSFVEKEDSVDDMREELLDRAVDIIRIKENAFIEKLDTNEMRIFQNKDELTAILFDPFSIEKLWKDIERVYDDAGASKVHLYIFNYSSDVSASTDLIPENTKINWEAKPIPEQILTTYKKLFKEEEQRQWYI